MAEERTIDEDKDKNKKFIIRKNEDGEDELVYVGGELQADDTETDEEGDVVVDAYVVPEFDEDEDDEEAAVMTPEQLAEREKRRAEEKAKKEKEAAELLEKAMKCIDDKDFGGAIYSLSLAEEADPDNTTIKCEKYRAACLDFTDFTSDLETLADAAHDVSLSCTDEEKATLLERSQPLKGIISATEQEMNELSERNEQGKKDREGIFFSRRKRAFNHLLVTAIPFVVFLILGIGFTPVMFANQNGVFLILAIVFYSIAALFLIISLFTLHAFINAQHNVKRNTMNSATEVGRQFERTRVKYLTLVNIYSAISGDNAAGSTETAAGEDDGNEAGTGAGENAANAKANDDLVAIMGSDDDADSADEDESAADSAETAADTADSTSTEEQ